MSRKSAKECASAYGSYQQKRRDHALARQRNARQNSLQQVRSSASAATQVAETALQQQQPQDVAMQEQPLLQQRQDATSYASTSNGQLPAETQLYGMDGIDPRALHGSTQKTYFARQLMQPEWMSDIPQDLSSNWLVMPRPEGKRCLVISTGGYTFSRSRTGVVLHRFFSRLPSGGPKSNAGSGSYCVLDCIFQEHEQQQRQQHGRYQGQTEQDQQIISLDTDMVGDGVPQDVSCSDEGPAGTYYIQDVLAWRGYSLVDCGAEFRLFWLQSKLAEESEGDWCLNGGAEGPGHQHRFVLLPHWKAAPEGLTLAASYGASSTAAAVATGAFPNSFQPFMQDGVYFRHVEGHYQLGGQTTPLALLWKDESCSRYLLDTDGAGDVPEYQQLVLEYQGQEAAAVATADDPPVVLGRLPQEFVCQMGSKLRAGRLLRFSIREGGMLFNADGSPAGADLAYEGPANQRRGRADLISKIMFQWQARKQPLQLDALIAAAAAGVPQEAAQLLEPGMEALPKFEDLLMV